MTIRDSWNFIDPKTTNPKLAIVPKKTYAQLANEKYNSSEDTILSLSERFNNAIGNDTDLVEFLRVIGKEFRDRNPQYEKFEDMYPDMPGLSSSKKDRVKMIQMLLNATIQREADQEWVISIVGKFDPFFVNMIRLYPLLNRHECRALFAIWDGQHTTLSLLCIALYAFGMSMEEALELDIPVAIHPGTNVAKLRQRFIGVHDNTMTKALDKIDLYMQYVYAVRNNGDTDPWSMRFEEIQSALEEFGCFFTHEKFIDTDQPGAISRPTEIFPTGRDVTKWKSSVLRRVFQYHSISRPTECVEPLEIDNMAHIFRACDQQGIEVNDQYVQDFAKYLGAVTNNTWEKGYKKLSHKKHAMVTKAYKSWWNRQPASVQEAFPTRCNQTEVAPTWICQAIVNAGFPHEVPAFIGRFAYKFTEKELV